MHAVINFIHTTGTTGDLYTTIPLSKGTEDGASFFAFEQTSEFQGC